MRLLSLHCHRLAFTPRPALFLLLAAHAALAQPPAPPPSTQPIEPVKSEITVTGTRTATELDQSPVSTSLVTRKEMETRNLYEVDQALSYIEGVNAYRARGPGDNDFGVGLRGFSGRGQQSRTLILLDGQPLNNSSNGSVNWSMLPVNEFERVEVARGPFSSLYGGNAMGGVVNLITRPVDKRHIDIFGQYGSRDTANYSVHASDRFFGKLGLSFGYQRYQTGGYEAQDIIKATTTPGDATPVTGITPWLTPQGGLTYQVGKRGRDWFNQQSYRGRAEYTFSPKTFASVQYFHSSRGGGYDAYTTSLRDGQGNPIDSGLVSFPAQGGIQYIRVAPADYLGLPTGESSNLVQAQVLSTLSERWNLRVMAGLNESPTQWYITPAAGSTLTSGAGSYNNQKTRAWYGNVQLGWTPVRRHQLIFGTDARQDNARTVVSNVPSYTSRENEGAVQNQSRGRSVNQALYVQDQIFITETLQLVAGGRYDYWKTYDGGSQTNSTSGYNQFADRSTNAFTGKLAGVWQTPLGVQLRASVGTAFRNPSLYELYRDTVIASTLYLGNPNVLPERLLSYDVGLTRRFGSVASLEASYFQNRVTDLIYRTTDFDADPTGRIRRLTNAGIGRTRGVELALSQRPRRWLQFKETYTYANARILENAGLPDTVGKRIPQVPAHATTLMALLDGGRWSGSAAWRHQSKVYSTDVNSDTVRGVPQSWNAFHEADLSAGFRLTRQLSLTANAFNVFDRRTYLYYLSPGRQVLVGLRIRL